MSAFMPDYLNGIITLVKRVVSSSILLSGTI